MRGPAYSIQYSTVPTFLRIDDQRYSTTRTSHKISIIATTDKEKMIFESQTAAAKFIGVPQGHISKAIQRDKPVRGWRIRQE